MNRMCGGLKSIYKIIAKILANRLVGVLGDIVNEVQSAFISDRQILDGPFILNEVIQWCKSKKKQSLIFKVDFEKAYDSVRWDFLDDVLKKFGFGNKWCDWIQSLRSSRGSIIINGSPTEEFQFFKGLKQGDPLSPNSSKSFGESFSYVLCGRCDVCGSMCDDNINTLVHVLECFFRASGLRINMSKSKIMGVNVGDDKIKVAASKLGCLILNTPFTYIRSCWMDIINESQVVERSSKPLKLLFPRIYALDNIKDATICMKLNEPESALIITSCAALEGGIEQSQFKELTDLLFRSCLIRLLIDGSGL
ncbi:RNA-directed DNA polymerase, eukaryota [Tanacetum coccineum]